MGATIVGFVKTRWLWSDAFAAAADAFADGCLRTVLWLSAFAVTASEPARVSAASFFSGGAAGSLRADNSFNSLAAEYFGCTFGVFACFALPLFSCGFGGPTTDKK